MQFESAQLGIGQFGQGAFLEAVEYDIVPLTPGISTILRRAQMGWGYWTIRQWGKSYAWTRPRRRPPSGFANLTITSVSGALIGKIRTDIQKSIVQSLEFTIDENGSADFILKINKLPLFEVLPFSMVSISIGDSEFNWYKGLLTYPDNEGTNRDFYEFRGFGLRRYLEQLRADTDYEVGMDLTEVVQDLIENWIAPFSPINYVPSKIDAETGIILANTIELGKFPIRQVLDTLATMATSDDFYYIWGVDGDGDFYWTRKELTSLERTFFIGYNLNEFKPKTNYEDVKNVITLQRQQGRGAGGAGWEIAGVYNNDSSVKKYGQNELVKQIPGYWPDEEADVYGNALIADLAEPKQSAKTEDWQANSELDFLTPGNYRMIMPKGQYRRTMNDLDDASDFSINGAGDLTINNDANFFVYADGGIRFTFQNAANQRGELTINAQGLIQEIFFYVRASVTGSYMTVGVGESVWNQITVVIDIPFADVFIPIRWDVSSANLRSLTKFALRIDSNQIVSTNVWIDKLDVILDGHETYRMKLKRTTYRYSPQKSGAASEFGVIPPSLPQYIAGLQAASQELKFTGEVR